MQNKFIQVIKNKWLKSIVLTIVLFAIIIAAFIAIRYFIRKANIDDLDFTKGKVYSISQMTKDKLGNLSEDVTISVYNMSEYIKDFAHKYENVNSHIKVEELDNITTKQDWKTNYGISDQSNFLIINSSTKEKYLDYYSLSTYDYSTNQDIDITEEAITNAILDVTTTEKPKICLLTGHNLYSEAYFQYLKADLESEVNTVEYVDLLKTDNALEECNLLVITALKDDITEKERDLILTYIKNGGEILMLLDPNLNKISTPNFQNVLDEYGVKVSDGYILEGDTNQMMSGSPSFIISTINSSAEIVKNINMGLNICLMNSGKLTFEEAEKLEEKNVTLTTLASTSSKAFYRTDLNSTSQTKISSDEDAANVPISAMLTKKIDDEKTSKMIIFANTVFVTNVQLQIDAQYYIYPINAYNNEDILLNSVSYLTEREDNITIRKNYETVTTYDVTEQQTRIIYAIIFAIPAFIIILGIVVWILRRRKK